MKEQKPKIQFLIMSQEFQSQWNNERKKTAKYKDNSISHIMSQPFQSRNILYHDAIYYTMMQYTPLDRKLMVTRLESKMRFKNRGKHKQEMANKDSESVWQRKYQLYSKIKIIIIFLIKYGKLNKKIKFQKIVGAFTMTISPTNYQRSLLTKWTSAILIPLRHTAHQSQHNHNYYISFYF